MGGAIAPRKVNHWIAIQEPDRPGSYIIWDWKQTRVMGRVEKRRRSHTKTTYLWHGYGADPKLFWKELTFAYTLEKAADRLEELFLEPLDS